MQSVPSLEGYFELIILFDFRNTPLLSFDLMHLARPMIFYEIAKKSLLAQPLPCGTFWSGGGQEKEFSFSKTYGANDKSVQTAQEKNISESNEKESHAKKRESTTKQITSSPKKRTSSPTPSLSSSAATYSASFISNSSRRKRSCQETDHTPSKCSSVYGEKKKKNKIDSSEENYFPLGM